MAPHQPVIFVNLPVTSVKASEPFYVALGFKKNDKFCDETTSCMVLSETIMVMLMEHPRFKGFMPSAKSLVSGRDGTETLLCVTVAEQADVDRVVEAGHGEGGKKDPTQLPEMPGGYGRSVEDPDGHVWEIAFMDFGAGECGEGGKEGEKEK